MTNPTNTAAGGFATRMSAIGCGLPGKWAEQAVCAQAHADARFPDKGRHNLVAIAKRVYARCPAQAECLGYALTGADTWKGLAWGVWGGTTAHERRVLQQRRAAA